MAAEKMLLQIALIATCFFWTTMSLSNSGEVLSSLSETVAAKYKATVKANQQIRGANGYCIDAKDYFKNGSVILYGCQSLSYDYNQNQIWTFQSDGTLRAGVYCLTATGLSQRSKIVIKNCSATAGDAAIWELQGDGEILNPASGLVLTALSGEGGTQLTLQKSIGSWFQTWSVGNDTQPKLATITGMNGLCLQISGGSVWLDQCHGGDVGQQWLIYPDGTIRPKGSTLDCLGFDDLINSQIVAFTCGHGPASQRWLFTENGTILNTRVNLVFDVPQSNPSLRKMMVYKETGQPNQRWAVSYLPSSYAT